MEEGGEDEMAPELKTTLNILMEFKKNVASKYDAEAFAECLFSTDEEFFEGGKRYIRTHFIADEKDDTWYEVKVLGHFIGGLCSNCFNELKEKAP